MSAAALQPEVDEKGVISIGIFYQGNTISQLADAALVIEKLGFVPEVRYVRGDLYPGIELFVKDVPSMIGVLRRSLTSTNHNGGSQG